MNVSAINQVSHRGLSNLTKSAILAGAMATSPVTALPANETNNPKTEYTTDMKDMPYYPVLEITAPQTKAPKTTGEKFIEWLTQVLTSIDTENYNLRPKLMARKNTPYYFVIPNTELNDYESGYKDVAKDIMNLFDSDKDGNIVLASYTEPRAEAWVGLEKALANLVGREFPYPEVFFTTVYKPATDIPDLEENASISKLEILATLYALDKINVQDGKISAEDIVEQVKYCNGIIDAEGKFVPPEKRKLLGNECGTPELYYYQKKAYNMLAEDFGEKPIVPTPSIWD